MNRYTVLSEIFKKLDELQFELAHLRDSTTGEAKAKTNEALSSLSPVRDSLWCIDKALESEGG